MHFAIVEKRTTHVSLLCVFFVNSTDLIYGINWCDVLFRQQSHFKIILLFVCVSWCWIRINGIRSKLRGSFMQVFFSVEFQHFCENHIFEIISKRKKGIIFNLFIRFEFGAGHQLTAKSCSKLLSLSMILWCHQFIILQYFFLIYFRIFEFVLNAHIKWISMKIPFR